MAVFSTNQNRHLYVAEAYSENVDETSAVGTIGGVKLVGLGLDKEITFSYMGPEGSMRSDRINVKNLDFAKAIPAADMVTPLKKVKISLDPEVNGGEPVSGQDYILGIDFRQWLGPDERFTYYKNGAVHATSNMDAAGFYGAMVNSLNLNFSREIGAKKDSNPYLSFEAAVDGIIITEKPQTWTQGTETQERVIFSARPTTVYVDGEDVCWGIVEDQTPKKSEAVVGVTGIGNGTKIADLEYFCMGERGDQYRNVGWPRVIPTKYLVDPTKEYNVLELHHAFTDEGVNSYRSEKDITIVAKSFGVLNSLISAINSASGLQIETL